MTNSEPFRRAGLLRRLAAICYDAILLAAVLFFAGFLVLPLTGGENIEPNNPLYTSYLFLVSFIFFTWFWTHGGQTLGMKAWGLKVQTLQGGNINVWQALLRFVVALISWSAFGLGYLWIIWDKENLSWHDRYSETEIIILPNKKITHP